jgi:CPA2 family monovalent cation:H+ antiporter-2
MPSAAEHAGHAAEGAHTKPLSLVAGLPGWAHALVVLGAVAAVLLGGHFLSRPLFRFIAESRLREIFTAAALLLVIGIALLMTLVDLSPALGTFLAGVVLADSEFRHELESDIEPFKGLLLGLFFITVGAGIDFGVLPATPLLLIGLTLGVMAIKGAVLFGLARLFNGCRRRPLAVHAGLAQAGEFGFVLLSFSLQSNAIPAELADPAVAGGGPVDAADAGAVHPLRSAGARPRLRGGRGADARRSIDDRAPSSSPAVGRFGQIVNRLLVASGVNTVILDHEAAMIDMLGKFGVKGFYGDASRPDLLHRRRHRLRQGHRHRHRRPRARGADGGVRAPPPSAVKTLVRAYDVNHLYLLNKAGADVAVRELFDASLDLGGGAEGGRHAPVQGGEDVPRLPPARPRGPGRPLRTVGRGHGHVDATRPTSRAPANTPRP